MTQQDSGQYERQPKLSHILFLKIFKMFLKKLTDVNTSNLILSSNWSYPFLPRFGFGRIVLDAVRCSHAASNRAACSARCPFGDWTIRVLVVQYMYIFYLST